LVVVTGPQVVESNVRIILLARVEIIILRGAGAVEQIAESVVGVCVRHGLGAVRELPCGKLAVIMIERCQRTALLRDQIVAMGIGGNGAV